jgi:hypothetical protein
MEIKKVKYANIENKLIKSQNSQVSSPTQSHKEPKIDLNYNEMPVYPAKYIPLI